MQIAEKTRQFTSYINGQWSPAEAAKTLENINPATGESLGTVFLVGRDEARRAVDAARQAFDGWRDTPAPKRGELLFKAMHIMDRRREELAMALHLEEGKLLPEARGEVQKSLNILEFTAGRGVAWAGKRCLPRCPTLFAIPSSSPWAWWA
jgi:aldehyde dehydrogenase (NAD+)